jgi:hypothetical protein
MTIAAGNPGRLQFTGAGSTGPFTVTSLDLQNSAQVLVTETVDSTEVETTLVLTTDYTVNAALTEVTTVVAVPSGSTLTCTLDVTQSQATDYVNTGSFDAETMEDALDKLTLIDVQQQDDISRSIRMPLSTSLTLPIEITGDPIDNQVMSWDTASSKFIWSTLATGSFIGNALTDNLDCAGYQIQWSKGADVASATALALGTDGNYFDVTGTTTITSIGTTGILSYQVVQILPQQLEMRQSL